MTEQVKDRLESVGLQVRPAKVRGGQVLGVTLSRSALRYEAAGSVSFANNEDRETFLKLAQARN